jgi:peptidoglycan/LPS O-acetylase OafA/YrhL
MNVRRAEYIAEIDGLRAISVLAVLFYHLGFGPLKGGFVGVDVFFVISGFLISRIIFQKADRHDFSYGWFYERRLRRIVPALLATVVLCIALSFCWAMPAEQGMTFRAVLSTLASTSNFFFYRTIDYFHNQHDYPLLHTWSLAIEEQFYLAFPPLIIFLTAQKRMSRRAVLASLALISFVACIWITHLNRAAAFYMPFTRWWELLAGSLLADLEPNVHPVAGRLASISGLLCLLVPFLAFGDNSAFPGWLALIPVLGTVGIITGTQTPSAVNALLAAPIVRWFGKISYSLYLVHWPVICFVGIFITISSAAGSALILAISILLAWLSWRFVEQRFRRPGNAAARSRFFLKTASAYGVVVLALIAQSFVSEKLWGANPRAMRYQTYLGSDLNRQMRTGQCFLTSEFAAFSQFDQSNCLNISSSGRNILLMGDSHSADLYAALSSLLPEFNVLQASSSGCPPTLDSRGRPGCVDLVSFIFSDWIEHHASGLGAVILSARWEDSDLEPLRRTVSWFQGQSIPVVVLGRTPEYMVALPRIMAWQALLDEPKLPDLFLKGEPFRIDSTMKANPGLSGNLISLEDVLCNAGQACQTDIAGEPLYFDRDHFTLKGANFVINHIRGQLLSAIDRRNVAMLQRN